MHYDGPPTIIRTSSNLRGMLFMLFSTVGFSTVTGIIRHLSVELHPFEIVFFTSIFGFPVIVPWLMRKGSQPFHTKHLLLHFIRVVMGVTAMMLGFFAISFTPLALVTALNFLSPIFTAILASLFFHEAMKLRRWTAIIIGFTGTLVILQPGIQPIEFGAILMLIAALFGGTAMLCIKLLGRNDSSVTITCYAVALRSPLALIPALFVWQWPTWDLFFWLGTTGIIFTASTMSLAQAYREADANVVAPVFFFQLIWTAAIGYAFYAETPAIYTWIGGGMIFASTTYVAYRERIVNQKIDSPTLPTT